MTIPNLLAGTQKNKPRNATEFYAPSVAMPDSSVTSASESALLDMPEKVLAGKLGQWCTEKLGDFPIAYRWLAFLAAAGQHVAPHPQHRANLNTVLIGPSGSGKGEAQKRANALFSLKENALVLTGKRGSAEGLLKHLESTNGKPLLWFPSELAHTMKKAQIENSSFSTILNDMFDDDDFDVTINGQKRYQGKVRLSLTGGIVAERFEQSFGSESTGGLYNRFLLGVCPYEYRGQKPYKYLWRPLEAEGVVPKAQLPFDGPNAPSSGSLPSLFSVPTPRVHADVYDARDAIVKAEGIEERLTSLVIRCAIISCAWDEIPELRASYLLPFWELARYQMQVRQLFKPNEGENFDAIVGNKITSYLKRYVGKWVKWREVYQRTNILVTYGMPTCERALVALSRADVLTVIKKKPEKGGRESITVMLNPDSET
jgi:hypothetical protein